jgi:hypothetical protein
MSFSNLFHLTLTSWVDQPKLLTVMCRGHDQLLSDRGVTSNPSKNFDNSNKGISTQHEECKYIHITKTLLEWKTRLLVPPRSIFAPTFALQSQHPILHFSAFQDLSRTQSAMAVARLEEMQAPVSHELHRPVARSTFGWMYLLAARSICVRSRMASRQPAPVGLARHFCSRGRASGACDSSQLEWHEESHMWEVLRFC